MDPVMFSASPSFVAPEDLRLQELEAELEPEVVLDESFDTVVVIDCVPAVPEKKLSKLKKVLKKICEVCGPLQGEEYDGLYLPCGEDGATLGFAFVEYEGVDGAQKAMRDLDGYKLDKDHTFRVTSYNNFEAYKDVQDEYVPKEYKPYDPKFNPRWWLSEKNPRDQFVIGFEEMTEVYWNEGARKPEPCYSRKRWTESFVMWSPHGTYMATMHMQGIILWAGKDWVNVHRFEHPNVKLIDFSPCENFLVTYSPQFEDNDNPKDPQAVVVWDIRTGKKLRGFTSTKAPWPVFRWSHDDKYLCRVTKSGNNIAVFESETMGLLGKSAIKSRNVVEVQFSPTDNTLCSWMPEQGDKPARVQLIEIPSKKEIRSLTLFNVVSCNIHWHPDGDYLCVKVDRLKSKKQKVSNFELFRMREQAVPIETLEVTENVLAFAWEPKGSRFAIIHAGTQANRNQVSFYKMGEKKVELIKTLDNKPVNMLQWAPNGKYLVLAGLGSIGGILDFFHVDLMQSMGVAEHAMATDLAWDPTGQYLCTHVSAWRHKLENGYNVFSFRGDVLQKVLKGGLYQFLWRPRPPTLLSKEQRKEIQRNLGKLAKEYRKDEDDVMDDNMRKDREKRAAQAEKFSEYVQKWKRLYEEERADREALFGGRLNDDNWIEATEEVEEVVEETTEVI